MIACGLASGVGSDTASPPSPCGDRQAQAADEHHARRQKIGERIPIERPQERDRRLAQSPTQHTASFDPAEPDFAEASQDGEVSFGLPHDRVVELLRAHGRLA